MKNLLLITILVSFIIQTGQTQEAEVDTSFIYDWIDDEWVNTRFNTRDWINEQDYVRFRHDLQEDGSYFISDRVEFNFDDQGNYSRWYAENFDTTLNAWVNRSLVNWEYTELNQELTKESFSWNAELEVWEENTLRETYYTTEHNEPIYTITSEADENGEWNYLMTFFTNYFFIGDQIDSLYTKIHRVNETDTLPFDSKRYLYNDEGLVEVYRNYRVEQGDTIYKPLSVTLYEYNEDNQLVFRSSALRSNGELVPRHEYSYEYTEDGNLESYCASDTQNGVLVNDWKIRYSYAVNGTTAVDDDLLEVKFNWNNSTIGRLDLRVDNTDSSENLKALIVNQTGQIQKSININPHQNFQTSYAMHPGIYALTFIDNKGGIRSEKVIVH